MMTIHDEDSEEPRLQQVEAGVTLLGDKVDGLQGDVDSMHTEIERIHEDVRRLCEGCARYFEGISRQIKDLDQRMGHRGTPFDYTLRNHERRITAVERRR